jgi:hypothetical protein
MTSQSTPDPAPGRPFWVRRPRRTLGLVLLALVGVTAVSLAAAHAGSPSRPRVLANSAHGLASTSSRGTARGTSAPCAPPGGEAPSRVPPCPPCLPTTTAPAPACQPTSPPATPTTLPTAGQPTIFFCAQGAAQNGPTPVPGQGVVCGAGFLPDDHVTLSASGPHGRFSWQVQADGSGRFRATLSPALCRAIPLTLSASDTAGHHSNALPLTTTSCLPTA